MGARVNVDRPVMQREAARVFQGLSVELQAAGIPNVKLTHKTWTEYGDDPNYLHVSFSLSSITLDEAGRLAHQLAKARQA